MILLLIAILQYGFTVAITAAQPFVYLPPDNWALDCGTKGNNMKQSSRTRRWEGDIDSKMFPSQAQNSLSVASEVVGMFQDEPVPYKTARLSFSPFTYTVPVSLGPKFIRLHFYDSVYSNASENLDPSATFFSVETRGLTLLKNFSVSLAAGANKEQKRSVVEEFLVVVDKPVVNLTFIPSTSVAGAFAFVNGIEVVSVPDDLYYTQNDGLKFVGQHNLYRLENGTALATMYRVNIGGQAYGPDEDTGMYRNWEQEGDYLTIPGVSVLPVTFHKLNITKPIQAYSAPERVYQTARSIGNDDNKSLLVSYRLTWEFPVHPQFNYLVRLHFCEIGDDFINKTGGRVFHIYISDNLVEDDADVIYWSGGKFVPYFRDYIVPMFGAASGQKKTVNLSVALQAVSDGAISVYTDALLNGIEIFKLNNSDGNLAGPNPDPVPIVLPNSPNQQGNGKSNRTVIIGIVAGVVSGVVLLAVIGFFIIRGGRKVKDSTSDGTTWWGPISFSTTKSTKTRGSSSLPSDLCRYFSLAEIKAATNNFEDIFVIGVGGFGNVYKGYIDNGTTPVAIKRLKSESSQGAHEFKTEIEMLSHLRHRHLVSLIGYCDDYGEMILVYEYMARGTLRDHLYKTDNPPLPWKTRLDVCIGAARGLHYLHTGAKNTIIHRDVKTTNILLDEKWVAKVSDFGLSKTGSTSVSKAHVTTVVKGSIGYLDPEYYRRQQLSEKSDVYSFGVVLCEVLCGRPPILRNAEKRQVSLAEWARSCQKSGSLHQIIDPHLTGKIAPECLKKYGEIAVSCMLDNGTERPSMNDVVWGLEFALQLQQNAEDNDSVGGALLSNNGTEPKGKGEEDVPLMKSDVSEGTFSCSWDDTSDMMRSTGTGATKISRSEQGTTTNESINVFSEIYDPKGR